LARRSGTCDTPVRSVPAHIRYPESSIQNPESSTIPFLSFFLYFLARLGYILSWMQWHFLNLALAGWLGSWTAFAADITPEQVAQLPPPANHSINFAREI